MLSIKNICIVLFLLFAVQIVNAQSVDSTKGPYLLFEEQEFDMGDVYQGDTAIHVFRFTNTGNEPLKIEKIVTTCSCTTSEWDTNKVLQPGEKSEIVVKFAANKDKVGRQHRIITVISNSRNKYARVQLLLNVIPR